MKKNPSLTIQKLIRKFDNQLLDILSAQLRSVKYSKTKILNEAVIAA